MSEVHFRRRNVLVPNLTVFGATLEGHKDGSNSYIPVLTVKEFIFLFT